VHGLGAVTSSAPNACDSGHVCDGGDDLMKSLFAPGDSLARLTLDLGRNDYYGHDGNWWDTKDSELLYRLDASLDPAPEIANLTATSTAGVVRVDWSSSVLQSGVRYRVYDESGDLLRDDASSTITASGELGETLSWTVRAVNEAGFLSRPATLHFKVGFGIVDAAGALLRDTVPPAEVQGLRASRARLQLVLRWAPVTDPIGLKGYRVTVAGSKSVLVRGTTTQFPFARVRGKAVTVLAVDQAGNTGLAARLRIPR
jgi:hypothetical protein